MRVLQPSNRVRLGLMGIVLTIVVTAVGQSFSSVPMLFATPMYYAQFRNSGGAHPGDRVRIRGMDAGTVRSLAIDGAHVVVGFTLAHNTIGTASRLSLRTDTLLGRRVLEIEPHGPTRLPANGVIPLQQTTTPYELSEAIGDVTKAGAGWDIHSVKQSLQVLTETIDQSSPHLRAALEGVTKFSDTIGKRDTDVTALLGRANKVAGVLGQRSDQIDRLLLNTQTLLAAFNQRNREIDSLLGNVAAVSTQVEGFIHENPNLNGVLEQLRTVSGELAKHKTDLGKVLATIDRFVTAISEAVASGPFFKVMVANLLPYQLLQPWVDAAFKKRGLDPEQFWRSAGLPAFRFPDPNGRRLANGAPPPAPTPLEGTPDHPGPAVPPGSPCSYTPAADGVPRPENPLPCAGLTQGPFGDNPYGLDYLPPAVASSRPSANGPDPAPGIPSAAVPGQVSPTVPGTPGPPLAPGPPGARTVPIGPPAPGPDLLPPPARPPGPPAPPGPGPQVPPITAPPLPGNPPFLPPSTHE